VRSDDDDLGRRCALSDLLEQLEPIHARHLDVRHDQVVALALDLLERVDAVDGFIEMA
jgi:hypothetical protein